MSDREYGTSGLEVDDDDKKLQSLGYVPSFKREFSNLATVRNLYIPSFFSSFLMDDSIPHRLALPLVSWYVLSSLFREHSDTAHLLGPLLICRHYVQYPAALGGPFVSTSTNTNTSSSMLTSKYFYRSLGAGSLEQSCASLWAGLPLHLAPPNSLRHGIGSSIAEIVSAFPTCGGLCVSLAHVRTLHQLIRPWQVYCISAASAEEAQTNCECFSRLSKGSARLESRRSAGSWVGSTFLAKLPEYLLPNLDSRA